MGWWAPVQAWFARLFSRLYGRTSAVAPSAMAIVVWMAFVAGLVALHVSTWLLVVATCGLGAILFTFLWQNIYFTIKNPDALRGEGYQIQRDALAYLAGDDQQGFRREVRIEDGRLVGVRVANEPQIRVAPEIQRAPPLTDAEAEPEQEDDDEPEETRAPGRRER